MILTFFDKKYKLDSQQSEVLKVAVLDSIRQAEYEQAEFDISDKEYQALSNKITALNSLAKKLGLVHG